MVGLSSAGDGVLNMQDAQSILFLTSGSRRAKLNQSGNLLIGDYNSFSINNRLVQYNSSANTYHQFVTDNTNTGSSDGFRIGVTYSSGANDAELLSNYSGADINFWTNPSGGITQRMTIKDDGKVGIGASFTAPNSLFHVHDGLIQVSNSTTTGGNHGLTIGQNGSDVEFKQIENAHIKFYTNGSERMRVMNTGNVGIGTTSITPYQLKVVGVNDGIGVDVTTPAAGTNRGGNITVTSAGINYGVVATAQEAGTITATDNRGGYFTAEGATNNYGVYGLANLGGASSNNYGGYFEGSGADANYGAYGKATNSALSNLGAYFEAQNGSNYNFGVKVIATSTGTYNHAGHFEALNGTTENYGVYASGGTGSCSGSPPNTNTCPDAAAFFSGDVGATGTIFHASDAFLKENIQTLSSASAIIGQLSPKTYNFKTQDYPSMHLSGVNQYGLIAEDVEQILPELVRNFSEPEVKDDNGNTVYQHIDFKAINYTALIPILIAGFQEQQAEIDALQGNRVTGSTSSNSGTIELEDMAALQLLQNDPNPFSESTMIRWNIPDEYQNAMIYFYDNSGNQINTYKVNARGAGELQVFGSKLSQGVYTYALVVDGKMIDSKKMLKSK